MTQSEEHLAYESNQTKPNILIRLENQKIYQWKTNAVIKIAGTSQGMATHFSFPQLKFPALGLDSRRQMEDLKPISESRSTTNGSKTNLN